MIYISLDSLFIGYVVLYDTIRSESVGTIKVLKALNVQPVLLTGDNEKAAASIARQLGISEILVVVGSNVASVLFDQYFRI